jgi:hypothetical protein
MFASGATVSASAENPYLIYEIAFFHIFLFGQQR